MALLAVLIFCSSGVAICRGEAMQRMRLERLGDARNHCRTGRATPGRGTFERLYRLSRGDTRAFGIVARQPLTARRSRGGRKAAGVQVLMFTEHPAPHYDFFVEGHRGLNNGVLCVPGAGPKGLGISCAASREKRPPRRRNSPTWSPAMAGCTIRTSKSRMDWDIAGMTGTEIYNTHADLKSEAKLQSALSKPLSVLALLPALGGFHDVRSVWIIPKIICTVMTNCASSGTDGRGRQRFAP